MIKNSYFFLIYLDKPKEEERNNEVKFGEKENVKCIFTKNIQLNEQNDKVIKIFKYIGEIKGKVECAFSYDNKNYLLTLEKKFKEQMFIFDIILLQIGKLIFLNSKIEQNKIEIHDKMNFFIEAMKRMKEDDKLEILFSEAIKLYSKRPSFQFLVNIFINVYNSNLCCNI